MRKSGEKQHQAQSVAESVVFGIFDLLKQKEALPKDFLSPQNEVAKNKVLEEFRDQVQRSMDNFKP
jgi:hypothetical protein